MTDVAGGSLTTILNVLTGLAGLGTAAMGLVDSSKAFMGGPSNFGFSYIRKAVRPLIGAAGTTLSVEQIEDTLRANWLNGVASADQKAKAKSLIHLGLTPKTAGALAGAAGVDAAKLTTLATKVAEGVAPAADEINVLAQFDTVVSAVLDDAYERGDQIYRNACKLLAMAVSTILAVLAGWAIAADPLTYFSSKNFPIALIIGLSATPLAPMAKDLASALETAANTVGAVRRNPGP